MLLALDFDGVISDSAPEAFVVALRTWVALREGTSLAAELEDSLHGESLRSADVCDGIDVALDLSGRTAQQGVAADNPQ